MRINPSLSNYFIGDQYKCQGKCIIDGFWTEDRVLAENNNGSKLILDWIYPMIDKQAKLSILDLACGPSQKMNRYFGKHPNISITGLDSFEATELAKRFNPQGKYYACDLDSCSEIENTSKQLIDSYDVVFCFDCIEHVLYPEKMLELIKKHSNADTKIYLMTLERDLSKGAGSGNTGSLKAEHVREWNLSEFKQFVTAMGFKVQKTKITRMVDGYQYCQTFELVL